MTPHRIPASAAPRPVPRPGLPRPLGLILAGLAGIALQASFPGANGELAFTRTLPPSGPQAQPWMDIFILSPEQPEGQRNERRLTTPPAEGPSDRTSCAPCFSPDGSQLAFARTIATPGLQRRTLEIHLMTWTGQDQRQLTRTFMAPLVPGAASAPVWSPDGARIAYVAGLQGGPDHARQLRVTDLTGPRILAFQVDWSRPAWSPDGTRIAFTRRRQLWLVDPDGRNPQQLTHAVPDSSFPMRWDPAWSPDGRKLAFTQVDAAGQPSSLWWMDADGSHPEPVARGPYRVVCPEWSPDGRKLAYLSQRDGIWEVYTRNAVAEGTSSPGETRITASPLGTGIATLSWRALPAPAAKPAAAGAAKGLAAAGPAPEAGAPGASAAMEDLP